ncbi:haloacid dehalogenase [Arachidicoccus ginsenosidimutans]|uniref:HAD family hydrolase n=1 Tax=Arachidicoccus sp. BS20 TaxID=1850526 RepID=UPI0007F0BC37|nr:HAD family phosphatase [Arachidicoccus sp. BS20]ANI89447.1 haloacid dehalogenase [Arachidicoccus sp. BS20]
MAKAFIFDMNGTMIDDMQYHTIAWHKVLNNLNANLSLEETKLQMYGKGEEMFDRVFGKGKFTDNEMQEMIMQKELAYQDEFRPHLKLIKGLHEFLQKAQEKNIGLAIGTAAPKTNVDYVLDGLQLHEIFSAVVGAEDVTTSKPDPEVFLKCASLLNVFPEDAIVFEDSPKGIEAARNGGFKAIAITSFHAKEDFDKFDNVLFVIDDYEDERLKELF